MLFSQPVRRVSARSAPIRQISWPESWPKSWPSARSTSVARCNSPLSVDGAYPISSTPSTCSKTALHALLPPDATSSPSCSARPDWRRLDPRTQRHTASAARHSHPRLAAMGTGRRVLPPFRRVRFPSTSAQKPGRSRSCRCFWSQNAHNGAFTNRSRGRRESSGDESPPARSGIAVDAVASFR